MDYQEKIKEWRELILKNPKRLNEEKEVIQRYGTLFNPDNLDKLTKEDFKSFLLMRNNKHWESIHRQGNIITEDMPKLIKALKVLLDEKRSLKERLDFLFPKSDSGYIKGLGRAIVTPILMVVYPNKYGVWNSKSEAGLKSISLLPEFKNKDSFAVKYMEINNILNDLARESTLSLWQLDEIIGWISLGNPPINVESIDEDVVSNDSVIEDIYTDSSEFSLESHLEDFLIENWEKLDLGRDYKILEEDGDIVGQQYITPIGRMDILAKSKDDKHWLVIELKKGKISDSVIGQTLRYIGWVKENKAKEGETVSGLVIVGEADEKLLYSLKAVSNIKLRTYSVSFKLSEEI